MTTYPVSTAPAAKAWLFGKIQTIAADPEYTMQVNYGINTDDDNDPDDEIWLGAVTDRQVKQFALIGNQGQGAFYENYSLVVNVSVYRAGADTDVMAMQAEARVWDLAGQIETITRSDPQFGGLLVTSSPDTSQGSDVDFSEDGNGRIATLVMQIHCESDI